MSRHPELYHWTGVVCSHFPHLSKPLAAGLAWWSLGMSIARSCSLTAVAGSLAPLLAQPFNTVRERLRDTYREAPAKAGAHRAQLELSGCWAPWWVWVLEGWDGRQLAIAIDATTVGHRFGVLPSSVVYRGCAVPVAWKLLQATEQHPWQPEWLALLQPVRGLVPADWTVIVLADRGLYAKGLFQAIGALGWHPLLRSNQQGQFRPQGWYHWVPFPTLVPAVGRRWQGQGTAFTGKDTQLDCPLLGCWGTGHQAAWLVLPDLPPPAAQGCWYGLRVWIEHGFNRLKSGGWQWQCPRMEDPIRAERRWLALAIATWWLLSVGGEAEAQRPVATWPLVPGAARRPGHSWRLVGICRRGWNLILAALLHHPPLPQGRGCPPPWPARLAVSDALPTDPEGHNERNLHL